MVINLVRVKVRYIVNYVSLMISRLLLLCRLIEDDDEMAGTLLNGASSYNTPPVEVLHGLDDLRDHAKLCSCVNGLMTESC